MTDTKTLDDLKDHREAEPNTLEAEYREGWNDCIDHLDQIGMVLGVGDKRTEIVYRALRDSAAVFERLKHNKPDDHIYHLLHLNCVRALQCTDEQTKNNRSSPLLRRYTDEDGNEIMAMAAWFYEQLIECLPNGRALQSGNVKEENNGR